MSKTRAKLKSFVIIAELEDGVCYQVALTKRQDTAVRFVINALDEPLKIIDDPLGLTIEHGN